MEGSGPLAWQWASSLAEEHVSCSLSNHQLLYKGEFPCFTQGKSLFKAYSSVTA